MDQPSGKKPVSDAPPGTTGSGKQRQIVIVIGGAVAVVLILVLIITAVMLLLRGAVQEAPVTPEIPEALSP